MVVRFKMMAMRLRYFIYILLFLTLSCVKEKDVLVTGGAVTATIPYTVVVHGSQATRASIDGPFGTGEYIFQEGDRLFIVYEEESVTKLYGVLTLIEGADTYSGTFEGTLSCVGGFSPTNDTELSATLVGPNAVLYTISDDKITATTYPSSIAYEVGGLAEYVKKYSHFTSSSTFGAKNFTLTQQTVFVNFNIEHIAKACLTNSSATEIGISIKSGEPLTTVRTFTDIPWAGGNDYIGNVSFTGIFKADDDIRSGQICVEDSSITSADYEGNFAPDQTLAANKYYSVTRSFDPHWDGFKIKATQASTSISFNYTVQFSRDNGSSWTTYSESLSMNAGEELCVKGTIAAFDGTNPLFTADKACTIYGNIGSLLDVGASPAYAFTGSTKINIETGQAATLLPSTDLSASCYKEMFKGCTSLTIPPTLPATTLAASCYESMFEGCTKLASLPDSFLPAGGEGGGSLAASCYKAMFKGCTGLTAFPELPATTLAESCYESMFENCTNNKLTAFPDGYVLPAGAPGEGGEPVGSLAVSCYKAMFKGCTKLGPESKPLPSGLLPARILTMSCYDEMFRGCTALKSLPEGFLPAGGEEGSSLAVGCYRQMFMGCSSLDSVPSNLLPATTLANGCYANMFNGCSKLETAPELNATVPAPGCYFSMFRYCSKLNYLKCALQKGNFTDMSVVQGSSTTSDATNPSASDMNNWTTTTLWNVINKWLNNSGSTNPKGNYWGQDALNAALPTGDAAVGAVPTSRWNKNNLP